MKTKTKSCQATLSDHVTYSVNAICHINEYHAEMDITKRELLKSLWYTTEQNNTLSEIE